MDIKAYIESGILESYAMGMTNAEETKEVEAFLAQYPELRAELEQIELGLEAFAQEQAIEPRVGLKAEILAKIAGQESELEKVKEITPIKPKQNYFWTILFGILSLGLAGLAILLFLQNQAAEKQNKQLQKGLEDCERTQASQQQFALQNQEAYNRQIALLTQENTSKIVLAGTEKHPNMKAIVYWNKDSKETFIVNSTMPQASSDQDYQLWAIVDGKPVSLGLVSNLNSNSLSKMISVEQPQAFAITLEPKGGSLAPTLENMVTIGTV